jgi:hypothetical protein
MGNGDTSPPFLTSVLDRGEDLASRLGRFILEGRDSNTHWIGDWWAPERVWTLWRREKSLSTTENKTPTLHPVALRYAD